MTKFATGFEDIDQHINSDRPQLVILGSRPGVGKTTLGAQITRHMLGQGSHIRYYSIEMTANELRNSFFNNKIARGVNWTFTVDDTPEVSFAKIKEDVAAAAFRGDPYDLIVVDYFQLLALTTGRSRTIQVATLLQNFKQMVLATGTSVLLISQINRDSAPGTPALRELSSDGLPQDADLVLVLYRDHDLHQLEIVKNRSGAQTMIYLTAKYPEREFTQRDEPDEAEQAHVLLQEFRHDIDRELSYLLTNHGISKWWETKNPLLNTTPEAALQQGERESILAAAQKFSSSIFG